MEMTRGIRPDILEACRRRNREAEARERGEQAPPPRPDRPGTVRFLQCACGTQAGFRVEEPFEGVKATIMARGAGWRVESLSAPTKCPWCVEEEPTL